MNTEIKNKNELLLESIDDRDPISLNKFWIINNNKKEIIYPLENINNLIFYYESDNILRCFEIESLRYLKTFNIFNHPITRKPIPLDIFDNINIITIDNSNIDIDLLALDAFQGLINSSVFIDYRLFLTLDKTELLKLYYELKDFWIKNFNEEERIIISQNNNILSKTNNNLINMEFIDIQRYILNQIILLLNQDNYQYKNMITYIILGGLSVVIHEIRDDYYNFDFSFQQNYF